MFEYFYEMPLIERMLWITLPILPNVRLYFFIHARTLKIFHKTNSKSLSLNSLRRMNTYVAVPLCIFTTILYFIMMFYFFLEYSHHEFITNYIYMLPALAACGFGLIILFLRYVSIAFTVANVAPIKNVNFYFNLNNLSDYLQIYIVMLLPIAGEYVIFLFKPEYDLTHILMTIIYNVLILLVGIFVVKKIAKKTNPTIEMEDCELKKELLEMAARVKRKKVSIVVVDQDKSTFGAAAVYPIGHGTIYLSDTLLDILTNEELKAVMAHEVAHLKYKHGSKRIFTFFLGVFLTITLYNWLLEYKYWYEPETWYLLVTAFGFFYFGVFSKYLSRRQEYRADAYILKIGIPYEDFKHGMLKIVNSYEVSFDRLPVEEIFATHPSLNNRFKRLLKLSDN